MKAILFLGIFLVAAGSVTAQTKLSWNNAQQEVLDVVRSYSEAGRVRDLETYLSYFHPDFEGWHNGDEATTDRAERTEGLRRYFRNTTPVDFVLEPIAVQVHGDTAVVHYRIRQTLRMSDGTERAGVSEWTDILVRENGKWLLYSDHGG